MKEKERLCFINNVLLNKQEVIDSVKDYIEYCQNNEEKWSNSKKRILIDMLYEFLSKIRKINMPIIKQRGWFYEYIWNTEGIKLILTHCDKVEIDDDGNLNYMETSDEIIIIELKAKYLSVEQYAQKYNVTATTVRQWIRRGKIRNAKKIGRNWLIPELTDKPTRGYEPVTYEWEYLSEEIKIKYPFFNECSSVLIRKSDSVTNLYDVKVINNVGVIVEKIQLNTAEREKMELALISEPSVVAHDWFQNVMYAPSKKNIYYLKGRKMMVKDKIKMYQEDLDDLSKDYLEISTNNCFHDMDGMYIWNLSAKLQKLENDDIEDLITIKGMVIPSESEFFSDKDIHLGYSSAYDLCDAISADMEATYTTIGNPDEGIKMEIIEELGLDEEDVYESAILYFDNIIVKKSSYLKIFLNMFDTIKEGMPKQYCKLAVFLLSWDKETDIIKLFLETGWSIKSVYNGSVIVYKKI